MANFIIIGLPRTGTTLLVNSLNQLDDFSVFGEICTLRGGKKQPKHWDEEVEKQRKIKNKNSLRRYIVNKLNLPKNTYDISKYLTKDILFEFLDNVFLKNKNVGFKLLYNHIEKIPDVVEYIKTRKIKCIHLYRNNFNQAISMLRKKSEKWNDKFKADKKAVEKNISKIKKHDKSLRKILEDIEHISISYEDLTENSEIEYIPRLIQEKILSFIEVNKEVEKIPVKIKRNSPIKIEDRITNYDKIKELSK